MIASLATLLGTTGPKALALILGATLIAGLVRGFVGFGAGMIFVPIVGSIVGPMPAVGLIWTVDAPVTMTFAAGAMRGSHWRDIGPLLAGALTGLPLGMWLLTGLDPVAVRWVTAIFILASVAALASGWRYKAKPGLLLTFLVGFCSGITTGLVGIGGPFIALFWLGGFNDAVQLKRNLNAYFGATTLTMGPAFVLKGIITADVLILAVPLLALYMLGVAAGLGGFKHSSDAVYRRAALVMSALAAIMSLPALDAWLR